MPQKGMRPSVVKMESSSSSRDLCKPVDANRNPQYNLQHRHFGKILD
jgi:hypothetical protein